MTVLDATLLENEDQIGEQAGEQAVECQEAELPQAEPSPAEVLTHMDESQWPNTITITDLFESHDTKVTLLLEKGEDERWRGGFHVYRNYDTAPHDKTWTEEPAKIGEHDGYAKLADAIKYAADRAEHWIDINSADDDENADTALEYIGDWLDSLDENSVDVTMFDGAAKEEQAEQSEEQSAVEVPDASTPAVETPSIKPPVFVPTVFAPIQRDAIIEHEKRKHELAMEIAYSHIALAKAKADCKMLTKAIDTTRIKLEQLVEDGPEQLPLFDQNPINEKAFTGAAEQHALQAEQAGQAEPDADIAILCDPLQPAASGEMATVEPASREPTSSDPPLSEDAQLIAEAASELWRQTKIADLPDITPKIVEILEAERIVTVGDWVDWPANHPGLEYTQIKNAAGGLTEKRYEKIMEAITAATAGQG